MNGVLEVKLDEPAGWARLFAVSPRRPSAVDLICGGQTTDERVAAFVAAVRSQVTDADTRSLSKVVIVLDPTGSKEEREARRRALYATLEQQAIEADASAHDADRPGVELLASGSFDLAALGEVLATVPTRSAVFICNAARYRDDAVATPEDAVAATAKSPLGVLSLVAGESLWVAQLSRTVELVHTAAAAASAYAIIDAGKRPPADPVHVEQLRGLPCGLILDDSESVPLELLRRLLALAAEGALSEVEAKLELSGLDERAKALARAQCLLIATPGPSAFEAVRSHFEELRQGASPALLVLLARIAADAGEVGLAKTSLDDAIAGSAPDREILVQAFRLSEILHNTEGVDAAREKLRLLYPGSALVRELEFERAMEDGEYELATRLWLEKFAEAFPMQYVDRLALALAATGPADYEGLLKRVSLDDPQRFHDALARCVTHATNRNDWRGAITIATQWSGNDMEEALAASIVGALRALVTSTRELERAASEAFAAGCKLVVRFLAAHPEHARLRARLASILSVSRVGPLGPAVLFWILQTPPEIAASKETPIDEDSAPDFSAVLEALCSRLESSAMSLGVGAITVAGLDWSPSKILASCVAGIHLLTRATTGGLGSKQEIHLPLHVAMLVARAAGRETLDLEMLRSVAQGFSASSRHQVARDLAEHGLVVVAGQRPDPRRNRIAWSLYADVYQRARNPFEALIGLACARLCATDVPPEQALEEEMLAIRVLRDVGLLAHARSVLAAAHALVPHVSNRLRARHRLDLLDVGTRLIELDGDDTSFVASSDTLAGGLLRAAADAKRLGEDPFVIGVLLAQVLARMRRLNVEAPAALRLEYASLLGAISPERAADLRALEGSPPDAPAFEKRMTDARGVADFAGDAVTAAFVSRRRLSRLAHEGNVAELLAALELTMEQPTFDFEEWRPDELAPLRETFIRWLAESAGKPAEALLALSRRLEPEPANSRLIDPDGARRLLCDISKTGVDVHVLGLSSDELLVRCSALSGELKASVEPVEVFSHAALDAWRKQHPGAYGAPALYNPRDPSGITQVELSLKGVGISAPPARSAAFVMGGELASVPPNLLLENGELAGTLGARATIPSLTWFSTSRSRLPHLSGRWAIWFAEASDAFSPLSVLRNGLPGIAAAHDVEVIDSGGLDRLAGADLAIVCAHGTVRGENGMFAVVGDESETRLPASAVASSLRGPAAVVLFVCSAGRTDRSRFSTVAIGLANELLRSGCRAVVASPWPLDVLVPPRWLGPFLRELRSGATLLRSVHSANEVVRASSAHPAHFLALNLYGDPLLMLNPA